MITKFKAEVVNHELVYPNGAYVRHHLAKLEGKQVTVTIERPKRKRTLDANGYYWGVVLPLIADEMGEDNLNYVHALMKSMFLTKIKVIKGKEYTAVGNTKNMTTVRFGEFIDQVRRFAAKELNVNIPDPDPDHNAYAYLIED